MFRVDTASVAQLFQSRPTLCDPPDCSLPGSSVHVILQASALDWVAMPSSRESSQGIEPGSPALQADSSPLSHQRSPELTLSIHILEKWAQRREVNSLKGKCKQLPVSEEIIKVTSCQRIPKGALQHILSVGMAKILEGPCHQQGRGETQLSCSTGRSKAVQFFQREMCQQVLKLSAWLAYNLTIPFLYINPYETISQVHVRTCMRFSVQTFFVCQQRVGGKLNVHP